MIDPYIQFPKLMKRVERLVADAFPIESQRHVMNVRNLHWENAGSAIRGNIEAHKDAKIKDKTLAAQLVGDVSIRIKGGNIIDSKRGFVLVTLPHITSRSSYIVSGKEVQTVNQLRLRPGPYTRFTADDNTETFINAAGGGYRVIFNRETKVLRLRSGSTYVYLYPVLKGLGVQDMEMADAWGTEIVAANKKHDKPEQLARLYKAMRPYSEAPASRGDLATAIDSFFRSKALDPKISQLTLRESFNQITPRLLMKAASKAIDLAGGAVEPDDTESLAFKSIHSVEDFVPEKLAKAIPGIIITIRRKMDRTPKISALMSPASFSGPVINWFLTSEFNRYSEQQNPIDIISTNQLTTTMGEGGIKNLHAVTDQLRVVHPSQMGFLDPTHTPEGGRIGVTGHLTIGARKVGNSLFTSVVAAKTGASVSKSAQDLEDAVVAFYDQYDFSKRPPIPIAPKVKARKIGKIQLVPSRDVDYIFHEPKSLFSATTNTIPFLNNNHANRILMADRHIEQAVSLVDPDKPLVQARFEGNMGYEDFLGMASNRVSPASGRIVRVTKTGVTIKDTKGKLHVVPLHYNYPLNGGTFLTDTAVVKTGDLIKQGQLIAENNFTKNGALAIGKNLKVAFIPYKGYNFEDGIVISEGAAQKLTSEHKHEIRLDITPNTVVGLKRWLAHYPDEAPSVDRTKYDSSGVIKKGMEVTRDEVLIPAVERVTPHEEYDYDKLHKSLRQPWRNVAVRWGSDFPGKIVDVVKMAKFIKIFVKTNEAMQIGDKLSNRHGAKGIIVNILPDNEMYKDEGGDTIDVLFNPAGIPGRVNPGHLFEAAAGKIAGKTGKTYLADNFDTSMSTLDKVEADLKKAGVKDEEAIYDPVANKNIPDITVGNVHFMKLQHQVRTKFKAKGIGGYTTDEQPSKVSGRAISSQNIGSGELFSLLASGSIHFLRDAVTLKSQSNPDFWRAMQTGRPLPPPKQPYILDKFVSYMEGAGINLKRDGTILKALPMTDTEVMLRSKGEVMNPHVVRASDLKPEEGGLFDKGITGGYDGVNWTHIDLETPVPNPLTERALISVAGLKPAQFKGIMKGSLFVTPNGKITTDGDKGLPTGEGLKALLDKVDVSKSLKSTIKEVRIAKGTKLDLLNKRRRYLQALKDSKLSPSEAYIQSKMAVIPPKFRPIYPLPDGSLNVADPNHGYREILMVNNQLKDLRKQGVDNKNMANIRANLYAAVQGMTGMAEPLTRSKNFKGFVATIKGRQNKYGLFQGSVVKRPQDLSGRSTIIPDPSLGIDDVGIPEAMAMQIYKPFVVKRMVNLGITPNDALDKIESEDPIAKSALKAEMDERPVYLNRAPSLHKFSMLPFKPIPIGGRAIMINPLIVRGYNADFDGDQQIGSVLLHLDSKSLILVEEKYGKRFVEDRDVTARYKCCVPAFKSGRLIMVDLEDFPAHQKSKTTNGQNGPIDWYKIPRGTRVLAYNESSGSLEWATATIWSKHHDRLVEIVDLQSGRQIITDDDPRAVYGIRAGSIEFVRSTPKKAVKDGVFVPRMATAEMPDFEPEYIPARNIREARLHLNEKIDLTEDFGYLLGALVGDGWPVFVRDDARGLSLAGITDEVVARCDRAVGSLFNGSAPECCPVTSEESYGESRRVTWTSVELGWFVFDLIGRGAENKHLPPWVFSCRREFRFSVFAGLIDTDGGVGVSRAKKKPQLMANYSSISLRLVREVKFLAASLGIDSRITPSKTPAGEPFWVLSFSNIGIKEWGGAGLQNPDKIRKIVETPVNPDSPVVARFDIVPISFGLARRIRETLKSPRNASKEKKSTYVVLSKAITTGSMSRQMALKILDLFEMIDHPDYGRWKTIVRSDVKWDRTVSFEKTGIKETGYDLTVPGFETFVSIDGIVLSNTMGVHVPVSEEARVEAFANLPSNQLFSIRDDSIMHAPTKEAVLGIYLMTKPAGKKVTIGSVKEMLAKFQRKEIAVNQPVVIKGQTWTPGQALIDDIFPEGSKPGNVVISNKVLQQLLFEVSRKHPKKAGQIITKIKDLGNHYVTDIGFSVGLKDLRIDYRERDRILAKAAVKSKRLGFARAYGEANKELQTMVAKQKKNRFVVGSISSGAFGKGGQVTQMIAAPVAVEDHKGEIIPVPIGRSFAEGHDIASYWATIPGARKGLADKGLKTADTGALSKKLINTTIEERISVRDCGTIRGIDMPVESREALDRVVADGPRKGQLVDPLLIRSLKGRGAKSILVRSPLTCQAQRGTCVQCFGLLENGQFPPIGYHVGVLAGQAISEPLTQLTLRAFHTGGVIGRKRVGFERIKQILEMPENVPGRAVLAQSAGKITSVKKSAGGGWLVDVGATEHFVPLERGLAIRKGQAVKAGQQISQTGVIKPQELLAATGDMSRVRNRLIKDMENEFSAGGIRIKRKLFETIVKPMTNRAEVIDAGDGERFHVYRGDVVGLNRLEELNNKIRATRGKPIRYNSTLLSIRVSPYHSGDFIGKLMFERPHETIAAAPAIGATADIRSGHPITQYAFGKYFGQK